MSTIPLLEAPPTFVPFVTILYFGLAYFAVIVLIIGVLFKILRWALISKGPDNLYLGLHRLTLYPHVRSFSKAAMWIIIRLLTFYTFLKSSFGSRGVDLWFFAILFHYGVWLTLLFHGNTLAYAIGAYFHVPPEQKYYLGMGTGIAAIIGCIYVFFRRFYVQAKYRVKINYLDDILAVAWVLAILAIGSVMKYYAYPVSKGLGLTLEDYKKFCEMTYPELVKIYGVDEVAKLAHEYGSLLFLWIGNWFVALVTGNLKLAADIMYTLAVYHPLALVHVFLAELFMIYLPWAKMIHPFAIPFNPALYGKFENIEEDIRYAEKLVGE